MAEATATRANARSSRSWIRSSPTRNATVIFTIVTGKSIKDIVDSGLVVGPASHLNNPANNSLTGVSEPARSAYSDQFAKGADAVF